MATAKKAAAKKGAAKKGAAKKGSAKTAAGAKASTKRAGSNGDRWSQHVTETSDALDLEPDVFKDDDPHAIAKSLKASAEHSDRRKADPYRSAMSMLTFYINRAGHNLPAARKKTLEAAKGALRELYGKPPPKR